MGSILASRNVKSGKMILFTGNILFNQMNDIFGSAFHMLKNTNLSPVSKIISTKITKYYAIQGVSERIFPARVMVINHLLLSVLQSAPTTTLVLNRIKNYPSFLIFVYPA